MTEEFSPIGAAPDPNGITGLHLAVSANEGRGKVPRPVGAAVSRGGALWGHIVTLRGGSHRDDAFGATGAAADHENERTRDESRYHARVDKGSPETSRIVPECQYVAQDA